MEFGRRRILSFLAAGALTLGAADGLAASVKFVRLSESEKGEALKAQNYLNAIGTLKARFIQVSANGNYAEGEIYLSRPGKMRVQYDPPTPVLIVADGRFLIYYDSQLEQISHVPLDSTPAGILVRENVQFFGKDVTVTSVKRNAGLLSVALVQTPDPAAGELSLIFSEAPFQLKQWRILDAQGQVTTVSLFDQRSGLALESKLFEFVDPKFLKPITQ